MGQGGHRRLGARDTAIVNASVVQVLGSLSRPYLEVLCVFAASPGSG